MNTKQNGAAETFLMRAQTDTQLRRQLEQIKGNRTVRIAEIIRIATEAGYEFTAKEYEEAIRAQSATKDAEGGKPSDKKCNSFVGSMN